MTRTAKGLAASPQLASYRLVQAERDALVVAARTGVLSSWPFRPAGVNLAAKLTNAPYRSFKSSTRATREAPTVNGETALESATVRLCGQSH